MKEVNLKDTISAFETWINTPVANHNCLWNR